MQNLYLHPFQKYFQKVALQIYFEEKTNFHSYKFICICVTENESEREIDSVFV